MKLKDLFNLMVEKEASDLYLRTNAMPRARINGQVEVIHNDAMPKAEMLALTNLLLASEQRKQVFKEKQDIDFIHEEEGVGRFRVNVFTQRGSPAVVARHIHTSVRSFEELNLPAQLFKKFAEESKGLFLVCGPAGNGKSTAIASLIDHINSISAKHIITIEDPIEFLFKDKKSIINQRELGIDVRTYSHALRFVTQQSPDIIYIGNIRDEETMRAAITATELGTFVITTFHTINAVQTIVRMVNFFPPHLHDEIRIQLSLILKGTISLRLLARKDGQGRIPAFETMVVTPTIARLIREGKIQEIQNFIDEGTLFGMQSFKKSLVNLVKAGLVDSEEARKLSDSKDEFDQAMMGIRSKFDSE
ncbi:MAG TPA: PilT/PilU family type 4a pilus ATPase [Candidatus Omnitrophota bacterium]|nr:PilT/PilU family type 4a pilus ATPase [Candidatus Omnitrophota bacterium]